MAVNFAGGFSLWLKVVWLDTNIASQSALQRTDQPSDQSLAESLFQQGGQMALEGQDTIQVRLTMQ